MTTFCNMRAVVVSSNPNAFAAAPLTAKLQRVSRNGARRSLGTAVLTKCPYSLNYKGSTADTVGQKLTMFSILLLIVILIARFRLLVRLTFVG